MPDYQQFTRGKHSIIYDAEVFPDATPALFDAEHWQQQHAIVGSSSGRGTTWFFQHQEKEYVLRHFLRGGLVGKILHDHYLYTSLQKNRAWQEFNLLQQLHEKGLPVPKPVAAHIQRHGLQYTADIIIERIEQAQDIHQYLLHRALTEQQWQQIGKTIAKLHKCQVFHHDLNIHNIMLDGSGRIWLIDFDKCRFRQGNSWKAANLQRLQRSLFKEQRQATEKYHWQQTDWQALLKGYYSQKV